MKRIILYIISLLSSCQVFSQIVNTAVMDTSDFRFKGKVTVEGYIDTYYGFDFNKPASGDRSYFVSMARHNELTINLAYIDIKYNSSRLRARFVPGFGTYVNANYLRENGSLKNIVEASTGVKIFKDKNVWVDAGVFGSPYTNESVVSKDHLTYTRSFAPEYVPYYLSGLKISLPLSQKINSYLYLLNGWQQIGDQNAAKCFGSQLEYRPNDYWLLNWNTYAGDERSATAPQNRMRLFTDFFFIYSRNKFSATGCWYYGVQKKINQADATWWQANLVGRYAISTKTSLSARVEYFSDPQSVQVTPITNASGFSSYSSSLGVNYKLAENVLIRGEYRTFWSDKSVYTRNGEAVNNSNLLTGNITIWF